MKKINPIKIHFTGPESSGKTTMAQLAAVHYGTAWHTEYARIYLENLKRPYTFKDLIHIANGQLQSEQLFQEQHINQTLLFFDTSLLVIKVWSIFKYGFYNHQLDQLLNQNLPDLYFLCDWHIPWTYDPMRENPNDRSELFDIYTQELNKLKIPYYLLKGSSEERLATIIEILNK